MSVTQACILGIVIGLCAGVFLMGILTMARNADDDDRVARADKTIRDALEEINDFNENQTSVVLNFVDRVQAYRSLVRSVQITLLGYSTNG